MNLQPRWLFPALVFTAATVPAVILAYQNDLHLAALFHSDPHFWALVIHTCLIAFPLASVFLSNQEGWFGNRLTERTLAHGIWLFMIFVALVGNVLGADAQITERSVEEVLAGAAVATNATWLSRAVGWLFGATVIGVELAAGALGERALTRLLGFDHPSPAELRLPEGVTTVRVEELDGMRRQLTDFRQELDRQGRRQLDGQPSRQLTGGGQDDGRPSSSRPSKKSRRQIRLRRQNRQPSNSRQEAPVKENPVKPSNLDSLTGRGDGEGELSEIARRALAEFNEPLVVPRSLSSRDKEKYAMAVHCYKLAAQAGGGWREAAEIAAHTFGFTKSFQTLNNWGNKARELDAAWVEREIGE